jgi:hypothetical protein
MAGAVLAKGLPGLVLPALAVGAFILVTRDWRLVRRLKLAQGGALFLIIAAPWHILVARENPGFLRFYFINEHILRFLGHRPLVNYASLPVTTYLAITLVWFCPWSIFLPAAIPHCWPRSLSGNRMERGSLLVLLWAGAVVGFFALSSSRLEYYALPALPALALCVGRLWDEEISGPPGRFRSRAVKLIWVALCLAPAAYLFPRLEHLRFYNLFPEAPPPPEIGSAIPRTAQIYDVPGFARLVPLFEAVTALLIAGSALSAWAWFRRRPKLALICLVVTMGAGLAATEDGFLLFAPYRSAAQLATVIRREFRHGDQIVIEGRYEHHAGVGFYTRRRVRIYRGHEGVLVYGSHYAGAEGIFLSEAEFAQLWRGPARIYLVSPAADCWDRLRAMEAGTVVLGRTGQTWLFANRARLN